MFRGVCSYIIRMTVHIIQTPGCSQLRFKGCAGQTARSAPHAPRAAFAATLRRPRQARVLPPSTRAGAPHPGNTILLPATAPLDCALVIHTYRSKCAFGSRRRPSFSHRFQLLLLKEDSSNNNKRCLFLSSGQERTAPTERSIEHCLSWLVRSSVAPKR